MIGSKALLKETKIVDEVNIFGAFVTRWLVNGVFGLLGKDRLAPQEGLKMKIVMVRNMTIVM